MLPPDPLPASGRGTPVTAPGSGWFGDPGAGPRARGEFRRRPYGGPGLPNRRPPLPPDEAGGPLAQGADNLGHNRPGRGDPRPRPRPRAWPPPAPRHRPRPRSRHPSRTRPGPRPYGRPPVGPPPPAPVAPTRAFPRTCLPPRPRPCPRPAPPPPYSATPGGRCRTRKATRAPPPRHTHDPHEVTVQPDAVHLGDGVLPRADGGHPQERPEASDGPVFVDASGRRSRLYRRLGILVGVACAVYAVVIASTLFSGNSDAPWKPVPGQEEGAPAGRVDTTPQPSRSAPPPSGAAAPQATPSAGAGAATEPGDEARRVRYVRRGRRLRGAGRYDRRPRVLGARTDRTPGDGGATGPDPTQSTQVPPPTARTRRPRRAAAAPPSTRPEPTGGSTTGTDPGAGGSDGAAPSPVGPATPSCSPSPRRHLHVPLPPRPRRTTL